MVLKLVLWIEYSEDIGLRSVLTLSVSKCRMFVVSAYAEAINRERSPSRVIPDESPATDFI